MAHHRAHDDAGGALRAAHRDPVGVLAHDRLHRTHLGHVAHGRGGAVRIDVAYFCGGPIR